MERISERRMGKRDRVRSRVSIDDDDDGGGEWMMHCNVKKWIKVRRKWILDYYFNFKLFASGIGKLSRSSWAGDMLAQHISERDLSSLYNY